MESILQFKLHLRKNYESFSNLINMECFTKEHSSYSLNVKSYNKDNANIEFISYRSNNSLPALTFVLQIKNTTSITYRDIAKFNFAMAQKCFVLFSTSTEKQITEKDSDKKLISEENKDNGLVFMITVYEPKNVHKKEIVLNHFSLLDKKF